MIDDVAHLLDQYRSWLKDKTALRQVGSIVEITTPYLDRHNDYIQIYVRPREGGFTLSDDSYTLDDLEQSGCKLDTPKREDLLRTALNGFGVQQNGRALEVNASSDNFSLRKHNLIQAILAVNDLFYLATPLVKSLFFEDVVAWLDLNEVRYTPKVKFTGKTGYDHVFDFVVPKSRLRPERVLKAIGNPNRDAAQALAFSWIDTREVRPPAALAFALLNDSERKISSEVLDALTNYDVRPVLWSKRDGIRDELVS